MENTKIYWPILKGKTAEFRALGKLDVEQKNCIVPVIEIVHPAKNKEFAKSLDTVIANCVKYWAKDRALYVDGYMVQEYGVMADGSHLMEYIFSGLRDAGVYSVPVISNVTGREYNEAVLKISERDNKGVCLRIFIEQHTDVNSEAEDILSFLDLHRHQCDLIIDLRDIRTQSPASIAERVKNILKNLDQSEEWRNLVISGSSFPIDLTEFKADQIHRITRNEWEVWKTILQDTEIPCKPSFSDYTISHPNINEIIGDFPNASASIRYTKGPEFVVYRGRGTRQHGFEQFFDVSEALISSGDYCGEGHCAGDEFINKCAIKRKKPGNLTTWRWVGTLHHIVCVTEQLRQS
jgi:hypothetical protein